MTTVNTVFPGHVDSLGAFLASASDSRDHTASHRNIGSALVAVEQYLDDFFGGAGEYLVLGHRVAATGLLTLSGPPDVGDTVHVGATTYTFVAPANFDAAGEISVGPNFAPAVRTANACAAIAAAINGTDGVNSPNATVSAVATATTVALTARTAGSTANNAATVYTNTGIQTSAFAQATLTGGAQPATTGSVRMTAAGTIYKDDGLGNNVLFSGGGGGSDPLELLQHLSIGAAPLLLVLGEVAGEMHIALDAPLTVDTNGKVLAFYAGTGNGSADGGTLSLHGGSSGTTAGAGGVVELLAGDALGADGGGGDVVMRGGAGSAARAGGNFNAAAGTGGDTGNGGDVQFTAGAAAFNTSGTSGDGGNINFNAGRGLGAGHVGGNIVLTPGAANGGATAGYVSVEALDMRLTNLPISDPMNGLNQLWCLGPGNPVMMGT